MKILKLISASLLAIALLASCEGYEDYVNDYDYTATYFGSQKPLRTIVSRDEMVFQVGATLAGMREDNSSYTVDFVVDTSLLSLIPEASGFTVLPEAYYTLGDASNFNISKDHFRVVDVTLDRAAFTADPLSLTNTYALPLRITNASVDSILDSGSDSVTIASKNITILVVKYISAYHGFYYSKGTQVELDAGGVPVDTVTYSKTDLSANDVVEFSTLGAEVVKTSRIGGDIAGGLEFTMNADGSVGVASSDVTIDAGTVTYDESASTYTIDLTVDKEGTTYEIKEQLILRQDPESDLRFEEW